MLQTRENRTLLLFLTGAFALNHLDRHLVSITLNEIGREFGLSDLQLGTLSGLAFALVHVALGFLAARFAVAGRRKAILVTSVGLWSAMTMLMGIANNYVQLFLARLGVGVGEAGCVPSSHAMIAEAYGTERRASALAFFSGGANVGLFLAFLVGGLLSQAYGWRVAFLVAGAPGLVLALVMIFSLREPLPQGASSGRMGPGPITVCKTLAERRSTRHVVFGATITALVGFGALAWIPTFLARTHAAPIWVIGLYLAFTAGILGALGTWVGGLLADRFGKHDITWRLKLVAVSILVGKSLAIVFYLSDNLSLALIAFVVPAAVGAVFTGPSFAQIYSNVPSAHRPMATAIMMFLFNLVGLGLGPMLVGFASDLLKSSQGADSLRYAMVLLQVTGFWAAIHFWIAGNAVGAEAKLDSSTDRS